MQKFVSTAAGIAGVAVTFDTMQKSMGSLARDGAGVGNVLGSIGSGLGSIASGALAGAAFGPWGALTGSIVGLGSSIIATITGIDDSLKVTFFDDWVAKQNKAIEDFNFSLKQQMTQVEASTSADLAMSNVHLKLIDELNSMVDANGRVKQGYETRAQFILGELNNAYGSQLAIEDGIIKNYETEIQKIKEIIEQEKAQMYLELAREKYKIAIQEQANAEDNLNKAIALQKHIVKN